LMGGMQEVISQEPLVREMTGKERDASAPTLFYPGHGNVFRSKKMNNVRIVQLDMKKIADAVFNADRANGGEDRKQTEELALVVTHYLAKTKGPGIPTVEEVQDAVEKVLIETGHARTAKAYILYRDWRTRLRETKSELMDAVEEILIETNRE